MEIDLLIFDFDGTLMDTRTSILETVRRTLVSMGLPPTNEKNILNMIGLPLEDTFKSSANLSGNALKEAVRIYRKLYNDVAIECVTPFEGVENFFHRLSKNNLKCTIASSKGKESIVVLLKKFHLDSFFEHIIAEKDVKNKKPAPDMVLKTLSMTNSEASKSLVIGDTKFDLEMGRRAGALTCAARYGYGDNKELENESPNYKIDKFLDISALIGLELY